MTTTSRLAMIQPTKTLTATATLQKEIIRLEPGELLLVQAVIDSASDKAHVLIVPEDQPLKDAADLRARSIALKCGVIPDLLERPENDPNATVVWEVYYCRASDAAANVDFYIETTRRKRL